MAENVPFLAIWMITYNHEKYIVQAIESAMMQQTTFPYKLFIGEDCSTDSTREICIRYKEKYPDKIELLLNPVNNIKVNAKNTYDACFSSGASYIALLDGDDYWTDPLKLQKQVDFLEANPTFAICYHNVEIRYEDGVTKSHFSNLHDQKDILDIKDLIFDFRIQAVSCVFRYGLFNSLPEWFFDSPAGDFVLHMLNASKGETKYINDVMGVYRIHNKGLWVGSSDIISTDLRFLKVLELLMKYDFRQEIKGYFSEVYINKSMKLFSLYNTHNYPLKAIEIVENLKEYVNPSIIDQFTNTYNELISIKKSKCFKISNRLKRFLKK